ncbi:MAG: DUF2846 domain-containing protein [Gammaproteobacteria bacterium]|nr:DUF2846 domain-containing protein [Gammaproteobacteria bacterium]
MKSKIILAVFSAALLFLTGCASLPSPEVMQKDIKGYTLPKLPEKNKAVVYVVRPASMGFAIKFNVFVDDQKPESEVGYTKGSQYIYFNLSPGKHTILSKAENWAETKVDAKAGDIIFIQQDVSMGFLMARNELVIPKKYEGYYHVKNLTLGTIIKSEK